MIEDNSEPRERLEETLKSPYPDDGDTWNALLKALAAEFDEHQEAIADVRDSKFVDDATGQQLDRLASIFQLERKTGETDDSLRGRIKTALRSQITSATVPEIRDVVSVLSGAPLEDIGVRESYLGSPTEIQIELPTEYLNDLEMSDSEFMRIVENVVAVGVAVGILFELHPKTDVVATDDHEHTATDGIKPAYAEDGLVQVETTGEGAPDTEATGEDETGLEDQEVVATDDVLVAIAGAGRSTAHIVDDGETATAELELASGAGADETGLEDTEHTETADVLAATAGAGRAELHVVDDGTADSAVLDTLETTSESTVATSDAEHTETTDVQPAYADDGLVEIEVSGRGDPGTTGTGTDEIGLEDREVVATDDLLVAIAGAGRSTVHIVDDGATTSSELALVSGSGTDETGLGDAEHTETDDVGTAYANDAKVNIDAVS